ncbi:MAG: hypothetical protein H0X62_12565 [Bacteroidetes bacterium]|nr:hypothetical protein [Bacteroidota bacterium]
MILNYNEYTTINSENISGAVINHSGSYRVYREPLYDKFSSGNVYTGKEMAHRIYTVDELKGGVLEISATTETKAVLGASGNVRSYTETWKMEKKK